MWDLGGFTYINYLAIRLISGSFYTRKKYGKLENRSILTYRQTLDIVNISEQVEYICNEIKQWLQFLDKILTATKIVP